MGESPKYYLIFGLLLSNKDLSMLFISRLIVDDFISDFNKLFSCSSMLIVGLRYDNSGLLTFIIKSYYRGEFYYEISGDCIDYSRFGEA